MKRRTLLGGASPPIGFASNAVAEDGPIKIGMSMAQTGRLRRPVCAIDMPILIGPSSATAFEANPNTAAAIAPPSSVLRFISPPSTPV